MRIFNRLLLALIFAGLSALGVYGVLYGFNLFGYSLTELLRAINLSAAVSGAEDFVEDVEGGSLAAPEMAALVGITVVGLVLLLAEIKPGRPRRVRLQDGVYMTRKALEDELVMETRQTQEVLTANARVKARRRPGASIRLRAGVRYGEDVNGVRSKLRERLLNRLQERGIPKSKLRIAVEQIQPPSEGGSQGGRVR